MKVEIQSEYEGYRIYYPGSEGPFEWVDDIRFNGDDAWVNSEVRLTAENIEMLTEETSSFPKEIANIII